MAAARRSAATPGAGIAAAARCGQAPRFLGAPMAFPRPSFLEAPRDDVRRSASSGGFDPEHVPVRSGFVTPNFRASHPPWRGPRQTHGVLGCPTLGALRSSGGCFGNCAVDFNSVAPCRGLQRCGIHPRPSTPRIGGRIRRPNSAGPFQGGLDLGAGRQKETAAWVEGGKHPGRR